MKSGPKSVGLVAILFALTLAVGLSFSGGGEGGSSNFRTTPAPPSGSPTPAPKVIVVARQVDPFYLYQSASYPIIPSYMFTPLGGLHVVLTSLNREAVSFRQRVPGVTLTTNSTGRAVGFMAPGNYSCVIAGKDFSLNTTVSFKVNSTNTIRFSLIPSATKVAALHIVSPDTIMAVEPQARIIALLANESAPTLGFAELVGPITQYFLGLGTLTTQNALSVNVTLTGWYHGPQGNWAIMSPSGNFDLYPTTSMILFQFRPAIQVSSTVG